MEVAIRNGQLDIVKAMPFDSIFTLEYAIKHSCLPIVEYALQSGSEPTGWSLNLAIRKGCLPIVKCLVEHGCIPNKYHIKSAEDYGHMDILLYLYVMLPADD